MSAARLARGLSIDEAAHATKMRPDKILALENDDYSRFGSGAYAKGFLLIYSRFLGVDVSEQLQGMGLLESRVDVQEYQYLNNAPEPEKPVRVQLRRHERRRPPSVLPLVVFVIMGALLAAGYYIKVQAERLKPNATPPSPLTEETSLRPAEEPVKATPAPSRKPVAESPGAGQVAASPQQAQNPAGPTAPETIPGVPAVPAPAVAQAGLDNEVVVEPLRKAWVRIRKGSPDSPPIFEDYLYPGVRPLKLKSKGVPIFVEVRDQSSVQIRKNGLPIAYQAPGISIQ